MTTGILNQSINQSINQPINQSINQSKLLPGVCADPSPGRIYESDMSVISNNVMHNPTS